MTTETETTTPTAAQIAAARGYSMAKLAGRTLFYGEYDPHGKKRIWTEAQWDAECAQAKAWGMTTVHPKVADGGNMWGDMAWLTMLKTVADKHGLKCYPYVYSYGNTFNALAVEAGIAIAVGKIFGGVCPDMEIEYEKSKDGAAWATHYGKLIRSQFDGPVLPTLFAANADHPGFPYEETLLWASGWMPMAYYDEWTDKGKKQMTAQQAVYFLFPQWTALNKQLANHGIFPPPILPIIEPGEHLPASEVASWLQQMGGYGVCAFWYDLIYAPYASTVLKAPVPAWNLPAPATPAPVTPVLPTTPVPAPVTPTPTPTPTTPATPAPAPAPVATVSTPLLLMAMSQSLTEQDLLVSWSRVDATIPFDLTYPIDALWAKLLQGGYAIGAATGLRTTVKIAGREVVIQSFEGGYIYLNENDTDGQARVWPQLVTQTRLPGTATQG